MGPGEEARQPPPPTPPRSPKLPPFPLSGGGRGWATVCVSQIFFFFFLLFQNCLKRTEWETGRDFTAAARAVFNGVVNKCLDERSCRGGRAPRVLSRALMTGPPGAIRGGGREASGCKGRWAGPPHIGVEGQRWSR